MRLSSPVPSLPPAGRVRPLSRMVWDRPEDRRFTCEEIPNEDVQTILTLATQAPSAFNLQPWRFVVVRDQKQRDRLRRAAYGQASVSDAPVVVVAYGSRDAWNEPAAEFSGLENAQQWAAARELMRPEDIAVWLNRHVMVAFTYMMVAAEALGWDTAPMERFDVAAVGEILHLPGDAEVIALLAIGRQQDRDHDGPGRRPLEQLAFAERWGTAWSGPDGAQV